MQLSYKIPSDLTKPIDEGAPNPAQATPNFDSGYMDGSVQAYSGANPGRDQDRNRANECIPASYSYGVNTFSEAENEAGDAEGF